VRRGLVRTCPGTWHLDMSRGDMSPRRRRSPARGRRPLRGISCVLRGHVPVPGTGTCPDETGRYELFLAAVALPPLRPAAFFWAVVPPCDELPPEPDFLPPRLNAP